MNVFIKLKSAGKRRLVPGIAPYNLPDGISSLRQIIEAVVRQEVERYNSRGEGNMLVPFLTETEITEQSTVGKVGFGRLYSSKKADAEESIKIAAQGFEDGLFRVTINDLEATELDAPLILRENDTLTFIRLTFLAGRLW
jgi:hypothetical protein